MEFEVGGMSLRYQEQRSYQQNEACPPISGVNTGESKRSYPFMILLRLAASYSSVMITSMVELPRTGGYVVEKLSYFRSASTKLNRLFNISLLIAFLYNYLNKI